MVSINRIGDCWRSGSRARGYTAFEGKGAHDDLVIAAALVCAVS